MDRCRRVRLRVGGCRGASEHGHGQTGTNGHECDESGYSPLDWSHHLSLSDRELWLNPAASPSSANSSIVMVVALWLARDSQVLAAEGHADQPGEFGGCSRAATSKYAAVSLRPPLQGPSTVPRCSPDPTPPSDGRSRRRRGSGRLPMRRASSTDARLNAGAS